MPLMGNTLSITLNSDINNPWLKILGILFNPLRIFMERTFSSSSCIHAICRHSSNDLDIR